MILKVVLERSMYCAAIVLIYSAVLCLGALDPTHATIGGLSGNIAPVGKLYKINGITHCGGMLNGTHGFFQTPDFPNKFPYPISCKWLLYAPPGKKIVLYFTQYYLRVSLGISEYEYYKNESFYVGRVDLGDMDYNGLTYVSIEKPYMLVKFQVNDIENIHLRTDGASVDIFGFNVTYEITDVTEPIRQDTCSVANCAYLGNCLASHDFKNYDCHCFAQYYGEYCQYGYYCDPYNLYGGINMCRNGGMCRYFMGPLVNTCECPPMYGGAQCTVKKEGYVQRECKELGCSQLCSKENDTTTVCACHDGFRLMPDGKNCREKGRRRYMAEVRLNLNDYFLRYGTLVPNCSSPHTTMLDAFPFKVRDLLIHSNIQEIQNLTVTYSFYDHGWYYIGFYYMGEKTEKEQALSSLWNLLSSESICNVVFDKTYLRFDLQPALHALSIEKPEKRAIVEGKLLTVVCKVKGSEQLEFRWFKDGSPIDVKRSSRNMWVTRIPSHDGETRISVLSIESAHNLDEGEYKCQVSDWGETESQSVHVSLNPIPHMEVSPLSLTVVRGSSSRINCISRDEMKRAQYKYDWLRDGQLLQDKLNGEVIEDLFPSGSRLSMSGVNRSAVYTCRITSASATTTESCHVQILTGDMRTCEAENYSNIQWQRTRENSYDFQRCPRDAEGFMRSTPCETRSCRLLTWNTGQVSRRCVCPGTSGQCKWEEPSFVKCHSIPIDVIEQNLTRLLLGYQAYPLMQVIEELQMYQAYQRTQHPLFAGDVDKQAHFIQQIHEYTRKFLPLDERKLITGHLLNLTSSLIDIAYMLNTIDQQALSIFYYQMQLEKSLSKDPQLTVMAQNSSYTFTSKDIGITVSVVAPPPSGHSRKRSAPPAPPVVTHHHSGHITAQMHRVAGDDNENVSVTFITAVYKRMQPFVPQQNDGPSGSFVNSPPLCVDMETADMFFPWTTRIPVTMTFKHINKVSQVENGSLCAAWITQEGTVGSWVPDACDILSSNSTHTTCTCFWPGHYVVLSSSQRETVSMEHLLVLDLMKEVHLGLFIACVLSLLIYISCLVLHGVYWSMMRKQWRFIRTCFTVVMMSISAVTVFGLTVTQHKEMCHVTTLLLFFLYECAISLLFVESVRFYLHNIDFTTFKKSKAYRTKDVLLALGLSAVSMTLTVVVGESMGYNNDRHTLCWITVYGWEFFTFIVPAAVVITGYFLLAGLSCLKKRNAGANVDEKAKSAFRFYVVRSMVTSVFLIAQIVLSLLVSSRVTDVHIYETLLMAVHISLALLWLLFFRQAHTDHIIGCWDKTPCSKKVPACRQTITTAFQTLLSLCPLTRKPKEFKAFIQTEPRRKCPDFLEAEEALKRDEKYTSEIKEQLSSLLGSSTEGSKQSRISTSTVPVRLTPSEEQEHPVYCPCKECVKGNKIKPARCQAYIKETTIAWSEVGARPKTFARSQSVPDSSEMEAQWSQRRKSIPNPFPELERGISYISDGLQVPPDPKQKPHRYHNSRGRYKSDRPRPPSVSSDSSSSIRYQPPPPGSLPNCSSASRHSSYSNISPPPPLLPSRSSKSPHHIGRRKSSFKSPPFKSPSFKSHPHHQGGEVSEHRRRLPKHSCSDEHSSAVLSDDEMSDESVRLSQQLLQPRVKFADLEESSKGQSTDASNVYLEMAVMKESKQ